MFVRLYERTTDPSLEWQEFFSASILPHVILSIVVHTLMYVVAANAVSFIFTSRPLSKRVNLRLILILLGVMSAGYVARLAHAHEAGLHLGHARARPFIDQHYNTWLFLG